MINNFKWLLLVSLSLSIACSDDDSDSTGEVPVSPGSADFSKYIALGDSFAAGYSNNALFKKGQENAYTTILAQQFQLVGGGTFTVPYMNDNIGGLLFGGTPNPSFGPRIYLQGFLNSSTPIVVPVAGTPTTEVFSHLTGPFNNLGVPGAKSFHLLTPGYGNPGGLATNPPTSNPYFVRFASAPGTSIIADAVAQSPTFFSLWIGGNDVLSYASSGGAGTNQTGNPNPATYGTNDITDPMVFESAYNNLVNALTANGAKGVVANLPYINTLPYFTTVPYNPVPALPPASAAQLNQIFSVINQIAGANAQRFSVLTADDGNPATVEATNPLLIVDETLPNLAAPITTALTPVFGAQTAGFVGNLYGRARHAKKVVPTPLNPNAVRFVDYVLLPTRALIGTTQAGVPPPFNTVGVTYPLQDGAVLTNAEAKDVEDATDAYNATIANVAAAKGLAFVDTKAIMTQLLNGGIRFGNHHMTASYITGGTFSLDGIHPSARGYAYIANEFLKAIGVAYGSSIPAVSPGNYQIQYPQTLN